MGDGQEQVDGDRRGTFVECLIIYVYVIVLKKKIIDSECICLLSLQGSGTEHTDIYIVRFKPHTKLNEQ